MLFCASCTDHVVCATASPGPTCITRWLRGEPEPTDLAHTALDPMGVE